MWTIDAALEMEAGQESPRQSCSTKIYMLNDTGCICSTQASLQFDVIQFSVTLLDRTTKNIMMAFQHFSFKHGPRFYL